MAKSVITVTAVTNTIKRASLVGIRRMIVRLFQAKVPITTMNITPTRAASGICSIKSEAKRMKVNKNRAAAIPDSRVRPPDFTLITLWPIIAQPPMPPKKPVTVLATPWARHSREASPLVSVISATTFKVSKLSISPMAARIRE